MERNGVVVVLSGIKRRLDCGNQGRFRIRDCTATSSSPSTATCRKRIFANPDTL